VSRLDTVGSSLRSQARVVAEEDDHMGTIVVGYVPKPEGRAALRRAAEEAKLRDMRLVVVNSHRGGREFGGDDALESEAQLEEVRSVLRESGVEHEVRQLVRGLDPADDLVNVAGEVDADIIVIGLRRRSPVGKLILGSNAQRVLLDAPCPVLAVKASE
jgi:nucleotide-binding universal stress UspA family protein